MIILIGGTGFVGKHLCEKLASDNVEALTFSRNPDSAFLQTHAPTIQSARIEELSNRKHAGAIREASTLVYLASRSTPANSSSLEAEYELNITPTTEIIQKISDINPNIHIVYLSSGGTVYGPNHDTPIEEDSPLNPTTSYAFGKIVVENYLRWLANNSDSAFTILRAANPVGRWHANPNQGFINAALTKTRNGEPVTVYGDGSSTRDYLDADDLAEAIVRTCFSAEKAKNKTWNVGSGVGSSLLDVIRCISNIEGADVQVNHEPSRGLDLGYNVLDSTKIINELGWHATTDLQSIIRKVWID